MKRSLTELFSEPDYLCTIADIWGTNQKSYVTVKAHWLNFTYVRKSTTIPWRYFIGTHEFSARASHLNSINEDYLTPNKIVKTVTDNGSNFVKAFREYAAKSVKEKESELSVFSVSEDFDDGFYCDEDTIAIKPVGHILGSSIDDINSENFYLSENLRCCSHRLNLVAQKDSERVFVNVLIGISKSQST